MKREGRIVAKTLMRDIAFTKGKGISFDECEYKL